MRTIMNYSTIELNKNKIHRKKFRYINMLPTDFSSISNLQSYSPFIRKKFLIYEYWLAIETKISFKCTFPVILYPILYVKSLLLGWFVTLSNGLQCIVLLLMSLSNTFDSCLFKNSPFDDCFDLF